MTQSRPCEAWADMLAARHWDDLSPAARAALNAHVISCPACTSVRREYDVLTMRIHSLPAVQPLPEAAEGFPWLHAAPRNVPLQGIKDTWLAQRRQLQRSAIRPARAENVSFGASRISSNGPRASLLRNFGIGLGSLTIVGILAIILLLFFRTQPATHEITSKQPAHPVQQSAHCLLSTDDGTTTCQASYKGILDFIGQTAKMQLSLIQKHGSLSGFATLSQPFPGKWTLKSGSINSNGAVKFILSLPFNQFLNEVLFTGKTNSKTGNISGEFKTFPASQFQGTWTVSLPEP